MQRIYKSQREYGNLNMCTAVCYNVAMRFLGGLNAAFSHEAIDEIMKQSAEFYQGAVLKLQKPKGLLGVFDVMNLVQLPQGIVSKEFGGTLFSHRTDDELADVEGLVVMSLFDTLQMLRTTTVPVAFIATFLEHSIVFLAEAGGSVMLFDPLPASIIDVTEHWSADGSGEVLYSGVLFGHEAT
jgi:hypothetical protein